MAQQRSIGSSYERTADPASMKRSMLSWLERFRRPVLAGLVGLMMIFLVVWVVLYRKVASVPEPAAVGETEFRHDAGEVIAGEKLVHTFEFDNPFSVPIHVAEDGIQKDCGCAAVEVTDRQLEPRGRTRVTVTVNTDGTAGRGARSVAYGGVVVWKTPDGKPYLSRFQIAATVKPALTASPDLLEFSEEEVAKGVAKRIGFTSPLPIDWSQFSVQHSGYLEFVEVTRTTSGASCVVRPRIPPEVDDVVTRVTAFGTVTAGSGRLAGTRLTAYVKVMARHTTELAWKPKTLLVPLDASGRRGTARLLVWGSRIKGIVPEQLSFELPEGRVVCRGERQGKDGVFLYLDIQLDAPAAAAASRWLRIRAPGVAPFQVPVLFSNIKQ
ncbi:MAG: hypothetical protein KatS3mg109_0740 [Pirellulaceae bacterium]|nr:MAG: hypothetical protein KatS3mg109_0740 [Pirellulaceae bacterium]